MDPRMRPPTLAVGVLSVLIRHSDVRDDVLADLERGFETRAAEKGRLRATVWYWRQTVGVVTHQIWARALDPDVAAVHRRRRRHGWRRGGQGASRGGGWDVSSFMQDLRFAWRSMRRTPAPYLVALLTIGLGVGANAAMFSVVNGVLISPLPYPDEARLVRVWPEKRWSMRLLRDVRDRVTSFDVIAGAMGGSLTLLGEGEPQVVGATSVSDGWFGALGAEPALGRLIQAGDEVSAEGPVAVLSYGFWQRQFGGDPEVVGRTVGLGGYGVERRTIVGVLQDGFVPYPSDVDVWIPWVSDPALAGYRGAYGGTAIGRLGGGAARRQAIAEMRSLIPDLRDLHPTQFREIRYSPVDVVPLHDSMVRGVRTQLYVLLGAVAFVLLIACTNVANLLLARASRRRRETGLRLALGADRGRVLRQMVTESVFLGVMGGSAGLAVAAFTMPALRASLAPHLPRADLVTLDLTVVGYALTVSVLAGLLFGVVPGLRAARQEPAAVLGDYGRASAGGRRAARVNEALIVTEVALSLVLVVGAGLMLKSLWALSEVDPGFEPRGVLAVNVVIPPGPYDETEARRALFVDLLARVEAVPGIGRGHVATVNSLPLGGGWSGIPYQVQGQEVPRGESIVAGLRLVSADYFAVLEIPLLEGRLLTSADDRDAEPVTVVNEAFVNRHWPDESGLDRVVLDSDGELFGRVVGVVGNTRFAGLDEPPVPSLYVSADQSGWDASQLLIRTELADPLALFGPVSTAIHEVDATLPVRRPRRMTDVAAAALGDRRFYAQLFGGFAGLALLLGLVGVYGVMSYVVSQRTQEVGIRVALGASRSSVLADMMRRGMAPVLLGIGVGLAGSYVVSRSMMALLYEVTATDPGVYGAVALLVALTGVAAILIPATRASRADPATVLKDA